MYETAVFGYIVAVLMSAATVAVSFVHIASGHLDYGFMTFLIGGALVLLVWCMANWIKKENT